VTSRRMWMRRLVGYRARMGDILRAQWVVGSC
jgi:hypothetical protein